MQDSPKDDPWASLADVLGIGPGDEPSRPAAPPPAPKPLPPRRPAAEKPRQAAASGDWDSLASDLGIPASPPSSVTATPRPPAPPSRPRAPTSDREPRRDRDLDRPRPEAPPRGDARAVEAPRTDDIETGAGRGDAPRAGRRGDEPEPQSMDDGERRRRRRGRRGGRGRRRDRDELDARGAATRDEATGERPAFEDDLAENLWDPDVPVTPAAVRPIDRGTDGGVDDPRDRIETVRGDGGRRRGDAKPAGDDAGSGTPAGDGIAVDDGGEDRPRKRRRRGRRGGRGRSRTGRDAPTGEDLGSPTSERSADRQPSRGPAVRDDLDDEPLPASYGSRQTRIPTDPPVSAETSEGGGTADDPDRRRRRRRRRPDGSRTSSRRRTEGEASSSNGSETRRPAAESRTRGGEPSGRGRRRRDRREPTDSRSSGFSRGRRGDFAPVAGSHDEDDEGLEFLGVEEAGREPRRREAHGEEDDVIVESGLSTVLDVPSWVEAIGIVIAGNLDARSRSGRGEGRGR